MRPAKTALIRVPSTSVCMGSNPERMMTEPQRTAPDPTLLVLLKRPNETADAAAKVTTALCFEPADQLALFG